MLRTLVLSLLMLFGVVSQAAGELNNEASITNEQIRLASGLPSTVVVRTHLATGRVDVLHMATSVPAGATTQREVVGRSSEFKTVAASSKIKGELDKDSSTSSWYFYFYNYSYSYPTYAYAGYTYRYYPYYNFWYGGYAYSYYRWYW